MSIRLQIRKLVAALALFGMFGFAVFHATSNAHTSVYVADGGNNTRPTGG